MKIKDIVSEDTVEYTPGGDRVVSRPTTDAEYSPGWHSSYDTSGNKTYSKSVSDADYAPTDIAGEPSTANKLISLQKVIGAKPDGILGPETKAKLKAWQQQHGITADGIPGPVTYTTAGLNESIDYIKKLSGIK